jgi:hypothetical protein
MMRRQSVGMMMAAAFQAFGVMSKVSPHKAHMDLWGELRRLQAIVDGRPRPRAHSFTGIAKARRAARKRRNALRAARRA